MCLILKCGWIYCSCLEFSRCCLWNGRFFFSVYPPQCHKNLRFRKALLRSKGSWVPSLFLGNSCGGVASCGTLHRWDIRQFPAGPDPAYIYILYGTSFVPLLYIFANFMVLFICCCLQVSNVRKHSEDLSREVWIQWIRGPQNPYFWRDLKMLGIYAWTPNSGTPVPISFPYFKGFWTGSGRCLLLLMWFCYEQKNIRILELFYIRIINRVPCVKVFWYGQRFVWIP